jgi:anti-sigma factor RsiW
MDHGALKKILLEFYDNELEPARHREVEAHLLDCSECREEFARWKKTSKAFFPKPAVRESEYFVQRVMTRIKEATEVRRPVFWNIPLRWLVPAMSLAAMLFLAILPEPGLPLSMEALLVHPQDFRASVLSGQTPTTDETLDFVMGGVS